MAFNGGVYCKIFYKRFPDRYSRNDDQNGVRRYVTEVVVDEAEFVTSKAQNPGATRGDAQQQPAAQQPSADDLFAEELSDFQPLDDAELPF